MSISPIQTGMMYNTPNLKTAQKSNPAFTGGINKKAAAKAIKEAGADNFVEKYIPVLKTIVNSKNKAAAKATKEAGVDNLIEKCIIQPVLKPIVNSKFMGKVVDKIGSSDMMAAHMSTAGSFVTTATYANRTLKTMNRDEEEKKRAKVLALNQVMVTGVSTLGAYTFNKTLDRLSKNLGYKFREANQGNKNLSKRMKGFNIAKQLLIFSVMYRYISPVIVTPVASKLGQWMEHKKAEKAQAALQQNVNNPAGNSTIAKK